MAFAKITALLGVMGFVAAAFGLVGAGVMGLSAVLLLIASVVAAVVLEERDAVAGLVVPDLASDLVDDPAEALAA